MIFVVAILVGATITVTVYRAENLTRQTEFNRLADEAHDRIVARLEQHFALLTATESLYKSAQGKVGRAQFSAFVEGLELNETYSGIRGIGFARLLPAAERLRAEAEILENYGVQRKVHPQVAHAFMTPIVLLEPMDDRNEAALGYDMFSEQTRRTAMLAAISTGKPQASGPVELVQEITPSKQAGFLVYHPLQIGAGNEYNAGTGGVAVSGFVYAAFRTDDLFRASLATGLPLPLHLRVVDVDAPEIVLFQSDAEAWSRGEGALSAQHSITILRPRLGGRVSGRRHEFLKGYSHTGTFFLRRCRCFWRWPPHRGCARSNARFAPGRKPP